MIDSKIRNIAIIAHVDHGKTTLVDTLLKYVGTKMDSATERVMDSNDLEKERGITILAKQTGVSFNGYRINIVDTPGHADFGGEVERTLQMVEGFLLLVDAAEGVLPGTRFVLKKALELNLKPIVLINKIDRPDADIAHTEHAIHDLFLDYATDAAQLDFPILYGSSKLGFVNYDSMLMSGTVKPLLDTIIKTVPAPTQKSPHLQLLVTNLSHSDFLGTIAIGRIFGGSLSVGQQVVCCKDNHISAPTKITKMYIFDGLEKKEVKKVGSGDIVAVTGFTEPLSIGTTICEPENPVSHYYVPIDEPTLSIYVSVNNSPFSGHDGSLLTSRQIKDRLEKELKTNVALRVEPTDKPETFKVSGRGQLHLGILFENMRREGFEFQLSAPQVIYKTIDGIKCEPIEYVVLEVNAEHQGVVMDKLGRKKGELKNIHPLKNDRMRMEFEIPSRGLLGFRNQFLTDTRGSGLFNCNFHDYQPYKGDIPVRTKGALVSMEKGKCTGFALDNLQQRGVLFVGPATDVYEGQIIGENSREGDMNVNPCKQKKLTNMRASGSDEQIKLEPPRRMELERCMEWIGPDELVEVTPLNIRLRKKILRAALRK
jgi:GTP-binding protein